MNKRNNPARALFLDRDGVINRRIPGDYVKTWNEFDFLPGVLQALRMLRPCYNPILVVTNQQGIGKGIMTKADLTGIHRHMKKIIRKNGGHIDRIYYCPDMESGQPNCRKPGIKMGMQAKADFPEIHFEESVMVGDSASDLLFGRSLGMTTILLGENQSEVKEQADYAFRDLMDFYLNFVNK